MKFTGQRIQKLESNRTHRHALCSCDLDLERWPCFMNLTRYSEKMYLHTKN